MQSQRIKNVQTKIRKRILKGFPTRTQYVPIKDKAGKVLRFKTIIHLLKPFYVNKSRNKEAIQSNEEGVVSSAID